MMNNIRNILLGVLIVSISALAAVYVALEPASTPAPLAGQAVTAPPPPAPPDALSGFGACPSSALGAPGTGRGTFRSIQGSYDSIGRYTLLIGLEGRILDPAASDSPGSLAGNAAYVDFPGDIRFQEDSYAESAPGPATMAKLSVHPGYTRVSLSYRNQMPPMTVKVEVKCRSDAVALRYTFDGYQPPKPLSAQGAPPQALSFPAEPASPAAITQDSASAEMALPLETAASVPQAAEPPASAEMAASLEPSPLSSPSQEPPKTDSLAEEPSSPRESEPASDFAPQARDEAKSPQAPAASPQTPSTLVTISRPLLKIQAPEIHISQAPTSEPQASKETEPEAQPSEPPPPDSQASSALTASADESAASSGNELASQSSEPSAKSTAGDSPAPSLEESDELRFYAPCKKQGPGRGTLKSFKGSYDAQGRYVLVASLEGSVGSYKFLTDRTTNPAATYIDISGSYRFEQDLDYQPAGPVRQVRVGSHPGFLRLSLTYRAGLAPKDASLEILCQEGSLAIRYAFQENKIKEAAKAAFNKANPPGRARAETDVALNKEENDSLKEALDAESSLKPSAAPQDETLSPASASSAGSPLSPESSSSPEASAGPAGASGGEASLLEADLLSAALSGEPKAEAAAPVVSPPSPILPDEIKPIDPEAESMLLEADLLASAQESKAPAQDPSPQSSQTQEVADHFAAEAALQAAGAAAVSTEGVTAALAASAAAVEGDIDELSDYRPCLQADKGQGSIGQLSGSYDRQGRFVILASLQGTVGKSKLVTDHTGEKSVTFLELSGRYRFEPDILTVRMGPVAFYRMAIHDQVTRFSLTYRDHLAPKTAAAEILCAEGKLAIRYSFHEFLDPDAAAEAAASAVLSEGPSSSASDYPSSPALSQIAPAPEAQSPSALRLSEDDELYGWGPCLAEGPGQGTLKRMSAHYDHKGRLVFFLSYDGTLGGRKSGSYLDAPIPSSFVEILGAYLYSESLYLERSGPLRQVRLGNQGASTRIAFTWREKFPPEKTDLEIYCQGQSLAIRYSFEDGGPAQTAAKALALPRDKPPSPAQEQTGQPLSEQSLSQSPAAAPPGPEPEGQDSPDGPAEEDASAQGSSPPLPSAQAPAEEESSGQDPAAATSPSQAPSSLDSSRLDPASGPPGPSALISGQGPSPLKPGPGPGPLEPSISNLAALGGADPGQAAPRPGGGYLLASQQPNDGPGSLASAANGAPASPSLANPLSQGPAAQPGLARASMPLQASPASLRAPFSPASNLLSGFSGCAPFTQGYGTITGLRTQFLSPDRFAVFLSLTGEWGDYFHVDELDSDHKAFYTLFGGGYDFLVVNQPESQGPVASTELSEQKGFLKVSVHFRDNQAPASVSVETLCRDNELVLIHAFDYFSASSGPAAAGF